MSDGRGEPMGGGGITEAPAPVPMPPPSRARSHRPAHRSRRKRRAQLRTLVLLVAVVVVAVVIAVAVTRGDDDGSESTTGAPSSTEPDRASTTTVAPASTIPPVELVASDAAGSRYVVAASPFTVQLSFTSLCWVEVRRGNSSGAVLLSDALDAADTPAFTETAIWIRLGYPPAARVTVNGVALPPITGTNDPFNIEITARVPPG